MYWVAAAPLALGIFYLAIYRIDIILYIIVFSTPLSIILNEKMGGPALSIPSEPLLFGVLLLFIFKLLFEGKFDKRILWHPVTLAIFLHLAWMFVTSLTSSYPIVSFKFLASQLWFILPMYLLGTQLFRDKKNIPKFIWLYTSSLIIVIGYTLVRHAQHDWTQKSAHWVMSPFYNDHTAYAAVIAMFLPVFILYASNWNTNTKNRLVSGLVLIYLIAAIILSYTRAAWLSLVVAAIVYLIFKFRIRFYTVAVVGISLLSIFLLFQTDIMIKLERNDQDSATDINKHLKSISNISTDASNLERINRWNSALRMFEEKPFWGWGPGTYQFNYASFQKSSEMTIISTNAGDAGNAHSEYLGPLAEQGILGLIAMLIILGAISYTGIMIYSKSQDKNVKLLTLAILLGLVTYFAHGFLNNFLDTDKLSVPVWAFMAIIVALDVYHDDKSEEKNKILKP
jgi:O-antigen ligase